MEDVAHQNNCAIEVLDATLVNSPLIVWLLHCDSQLEDKPLSLPLFYLIGKWLILCARSDTRWQALVLPVVNHHAYKLPLCVRILLDSINTSCLLPAPALVSAATRCVGHILEDSSPDSCTYDIGCDLLDTLLQLYFAFGASEIRGDVFVCIFRLPRQLDRNPSLRHGNSIWRETAIRRLLSRSERGTIIRPAVSSIGPNLTVDITSICLLACAVHEATLGSDLTDELHALVANLQTRPCSRNGDMDDLTSDQNLFVLHTLLEPSRRNSSAQTLTAQVRLPSLSTGRASELLQMYDRFLFVQRVLLLTEPSLLPTMAAEQLVTMYHSLMNIMVLSSGAERSHCFKGVKQDVVEAILAVLNVCADSTTSSPWTLLLRQALLEIPQAEMGGRQQDLSRMFALILAGKPRGEREQTNGRPLKLMRTASGHLLLFV